MEYQVKNSQIMLKDPDPTKASPLSLYTCKWVEKHLKAKVLNYLSLHGMCGHTFEDRQLRVC